MMVVKNRPQGSRPLRSRRFRNEQRRLDRTICRARYPGRHIHYDPKVQMATLHPPAPFSGSARFHRSAKPQNRWTGNLTVDLPGRAGVALTGGELRAKLARATGIGIPVSARQGSATEPAGAATGAEMFLFSDPVG
jgi:hypothetical protein